MKNGNKEIKELFNKTNKKIVKWYLKTSKELGIDLNVLFEALKSEKLYLKHNLGIAEVKPLHLHNSRWGIYCFIKEDEFCNLFLEDYGKKWAITKEELEK